MRHWLDGTEPGLSGVIELAQRALELRAGAEPMQFRGSRVGAVFLNPSLRTRSSLEAAAHALGAHAIILSPGNDAWAWETRPGVTMDSDKAEHLIDAVRVLSGYVDLLAVRTFAGLTDAEADRRDPVLNAFADYSPKPVINLESALWHPLQGLADTATWMAQEGPDLQGVPLTLTWAPHPKALPAAVPNQVLLSAALQGMDITLAHPEGFDIDPQIMGRVGALAEQNGGEVRVTHDQRDAMKGARFVYAKSWSGFSGYADRAGEATRRAGLAGWRMDEDKLALTDNAGFMHCLPVRRNVVVTDGVLDGPRSLVYDEAHLRMWTAMALLERMFDGGETWSA